MKRYPESNLQDIQDIVKYNDISLSLQLKVKISLSFTSFHLTHTMKLVEERTLQDKQ